MIDKFRHDLDREQTYLVLRALDSHRDAMLKIGEDLTYGSAAERAACRIEANDADALRRKMAEGL